MSATDKQRVITYITIFYGYNKSEAERAYQDYSEERRQNILATYRAICSKYGV